MQKGGGKTVNTKEKENVNMDKKDKKEKHEDWKPPRTKP